jgi:benzoyl-CoA reductase/2-hydroxyglutaryl-CoA dehydratase subunit BcrC/BadD/HgdB
MRVFLASPWVPPEWIRAHQLEPSGIWCEPDFAGDKMALPEGVCLFAEWVVRFAEAQPDSPVIFVTACDQLRRGFDVAALRGQRRSFLFNLPATQSAAAKQIYSSELQRLGRFLCELGGSAPTPKILRREMLQAGLARSRLLDAATSSAARPYAEAVARFHRDGIFSAPAAAMPGARVPLAIVGGPFCAPHWPLLDVIENAGGRVVLNATETGERSLLPAFDSSAVRDDPFDAMADACFNGIADAFQRPNKSLYSWLKPRLLDRQVQGLVLWHFTACDLWRAEVATLREVSGLPVLPLEAGEAPGISRRQIDRVEAFVETLK